MNVSLRRPGALIGVGALALTALLPALPAAATVSAISAPGSLKVARTGADSTDLAISWRAVEGVDHYTVNVFDGKTDVAQVIPADKTEYTYDGTGICTRYRVRVTAAGKDGSIATTNDYLVGSLGPGGVAKLSVTRTESGKSGQIDWAAPTNGTTEGYLVLVKKMSTGETILEEKVKETSLTVRDLDPARQYSVKVTPFNSFGSCITSTSVLYGSVPSSPKNVTVTRDPATPPFVTVAWEAPEWSGYGPITEYEVGYGNLRVTDWVKTKETKLSLKLDPDVSHVFVVRAWSSDDQGSLSKPVTLQRFGAPGTLAVDPKVTMTESNGVVNVTFSGPVGSSATYPKMLVRIAPTMATSSFHDQHVVSNGAGSVIFSSVPCGVHTVTVTGFGAASEKEFARQIINRCDVGQVDAGKWKLVYGKAVINGNSVDFTTAGENRVMSTTARTSPDMVLTTTANLTAGWGYGIWARANLATGASVSGYSFQYDPGYANVNAGFGKALLLRLWSNGKECGTPLAKVPFPAGIEVYKPHRITVVTKGDTLYATIDGKVAFNVDSLKEAVAQNGCGFPAPTGTEIGFRTWNDTTAKFTGTTLN